MNITTLARLPPGYPNTRKQLTKTLALRARIFIHCFLVFGYCGETLALVVHILHENEPALLRASSLHANRASRASRLARFHVITIQAGQPGYWAFLYMLSMRTRQTKRNNMA